MTLKFFTGIKCSQCGKGEIAESVGISTLEPNRWIHFGYQCNSCKTYPPITTVDCNPISLAKLSAAVKEYSFSFLQRDLRKNIMKRHGRGAFDIRLFKKGMPIFYLSNEALLKEGPLLHAPFFIVLGKTEGTMAEVRSHSRFGKAYSQNQVQRPGLRKSGPKGGPYFVLNKIPPASFLAVPVYLPTREGVLERYWIPKFALQ